MLLKTLEMEHFCQYKQASFAFPEGLVAIVGPNGAGKSTIFKAILFALYGVKGVSSKKEHLKRSGSGPGDACRVCLTLEHASKELVIERVLRGKNLVATAEVSVDGRVEAQGIDAAYEFITSFFGMDESMFKASFFSSQKDLARILTMDTKERLEMILELTGLSELQELADRVREDARAIEGTIRGLQQTLVPAQDLEQEGLRLHKAYEDALHQRERTQQALEAVREELRRLEGELAILDKTASDRERLEERMATARDALRKDLAERVRSLATELRTIADAEVVLAQGRDIVREYDTLQERLRELEPHIRRHERLCSVRNQIADLVQQQEAVQTQLQRLEANLAALHDVPAQAKVLKQRHEQLVAKHGDIKAKIERMETHRQHLATALQESQQQLQQLAILGPDSPCPTCGQPLGEKAQERQRELASRCGELHAMLEREDARLSAFRNALERMEKAISAAKKSAADCDAQLKAYDRWTAEQSVQMRALDELRERLVQLQHEAESLADAEEKVNEYNLAKDRLAVLTSQREHLVGLETKVERRDSILQEYHQLRHRCGEEAKKIMATAADLKHLAYDASEHESLRQARLHLEKILRNEEARLRDAERALVEAERDLEHHQREVRRQQEAQGRITRERTRLEKLNLLRDAYLAARATGLQFVVPTLNALMTDIFVPLTGYKYRSLGVDDKFQLIPEHASGEIFTINELSGSEEDLAALSYRLALAQLIIQMRGKSNPSEFIGLDEPFRAHDAVRQQDVMRHFAALSQQFRQVLLITHEDTVKQLADSVIEVGINADGDSEILTDAA